MEHKRYLVFEYSDYYPMGGLNDFIDSFDLLDEVNEFLFNRENCNIDVYDRQNGISLSSENIEKNPNEFVVQVKIVT